MALSGLVQTNSSVAMTPDGRFDIAYEVDFNTTEHDVPLAQYGALGAIQDLRDIASAPGTLAELPKVSLDNSANAVVAWESVQSGNADILAERVSADGQPGQRDPDRHHLVQRAKPVGGSGRQRWCLRGCL